MNQAAENCRSRSAKLRHLSAADRAVPTQLRAIELNLQYCLESAKMARAEQADESRLTHMWSAGRRPRRCNWQLEMTRAEERLEF